MIINLYDWTFDFHEYHYVAIFQIFFFRLNSHPSDPLHRIRVRAESVSHVCYPHHYTLYTWKLSVKYDLGFFFLSHKVKHVSLYNINYFGKFGLSIFFFFVHNIVYIRFLLTTPRRSGHSSYPVVTTSTEKRGDNNHLVRVL